ncbi:MAG: murein DD-endopeptidase MepM/ murein hydrolase activator NlpD [Flavobacteriaceae bacterium]|jgi:murein DD-endopeptidase MepM/ murein hydrolase activator NlpD
MRYRNVLVFSIILLGISPFITYAQNANDLQNKIEEQNREIERIEDEIQEYQQKLNQTSSQKNTLQKAINNLITTENKIKSSINATSSKIKKTDTTIQKIDNDIQTTKERVRRNKIILARSLRKIHEADNISFLETLMQKDSLSEVWRDIDETISLNKKVQDYTETLEVFKETLLVSRLEKDTEKSKLVGLKEELDGEKNAVLVTKKEKATILTETKNQESTYKSLIDQKKEQQALFEKDLFDLESQLEYVLNPSSLPQEGHGTLAWPLDYVYITQNFGLTSSSIALYGYRKGKFSGKHSGIDFRANNDKVYSVAAGTVKGTGNTDLACKAASFGKWVLVEHNNGLSTIYSHLNSHVAKTGQTVARGDLIAFSGNTGYSTAPHLDLKVVPSDSVTVQTWPSKGCPGKYYTTPIVAGATYLNPLDYLPLTTLDMFKPGA